MSSTDIYQLIEEYEIKAIANVCGTMDPNGKGQEAGGLLDVQGKSEFYSLTNLEFARQYHHLVSYIESWEIFLQNTKKELEQKIKRTELKITQRRNVFHSHFLKAPLSPLYKPLLIEPWLYGFLALLVFSIEIPIVYTFTRVSLNIELGDTGTQVLAYLLAIGLPLCIGLAFKLFINWLYKVGKIKMIQWGFVGLAVLLTISLGLLNAANDLENTLPKNDFIKQNAMWFRAASFIILSLLLSGVGANIFELALRTRKRIFLFDNRKVEDNDQELSRELEDHFNDLTKIKSDLEVISKLLALGEDGSSPLKRLFDITRKSTQEAYSFGFEIGYNKQLQELLRMKKPIWSRFNPKTN